MKPRMIIFSAVCLLAWYIQATEPLPGRSTSDLRSRIKNQYTEQLSMYSDAKDSLNGHAVVVTSPAIW